MIVEDDNFISPLPHSKIKEENSDNFKFKRSSLEQALDLSKTCEKNAQYEFPIKAINIANQTELSMRKNEEKTFDFIDKFCEYRNNISDSADFQKIEIDSDDVQEKEKMNIDPNINYDLDSDTIKNQNKNEDTSILSYESLEMQEEETDIQKNHHEDIKYICEKKVFNKLKKNTKKRQNID